jgi:hypothetical protein
MSSLRWLSLAGWLAMLPVAVAQSVTPHAGFVYPAGGRQGSTFKVSVGGQFLDGVSGASVSGAGIEARVIGLNKPISNNAYMKLRDALRDLSDRKKAASKQAEGDHPDAAKKAVKWTEADEKELARVREQFTNAVRRPANPSIAERVSVQISMAADAAPGTRELRLITKGGVTNPLVFCVGQLAEATKSEARVELEVRNDNKRSRYARTTEHTVNEDAVAITLPSVANGQIDPGGVDRYKFKAVKGQHLVIAAAARELIPYISDAVPGWFQATLTLYDAKGKQLDYADHYRFHPDPVLFDEIPADGEYTVEIRDSIYRGREDFVYRLAVGELPYVTSTFPLGGKLGGKTNVEVTGWNLPESKVTEDVKGSKGKKVEPGIYPLSAPKGGWIFNRVPFSLDTLAEIQEKEPNNDPAAAQKVKLPIIVNGRIDQPGDLDVFRFDGRAGEQVVAEVFARRLDSPLDSILKLTDANGKLLAANDDYDDKGAGLLTHQADSRILTTLPATGTYYLSLGDTQHKGGREYAYRLRISRPQPNFELRVVPSSLNVAAGSTVPVTVYALRRDGFEGDIALTLKDAPRGFFLSGAWIPANQDKARLTLTVPGAKSDKPNNLHLEGKATIQGKTVVRPGVPAEDMEQAFAYHHLVAEKDWVVRSTGSGRTTIGWKLLGEQKLRFVPGTVTQVRLSAPIGGYATQVQFALNQPPDGIAIRKVSFDKDSVTISLAADAAKVKPGLKGNLLVDAFWQRSSQRKGTTKQTKTSLGTVPAIPFEITGTLQARQ